MKFNKLKLIFSVLIFLLVPLCIYSQGKPKSVKQQEKAIQKKKEARDKKNKKIYDAAIKHRMKIQSKETRKSMKKMKHQANLVNDHRKEFFIVRWFRKKQK